VQKNEKNMKMRVKFKRAGRSVDIVLVLKLVFEILLNIRVLHEDLERQHQQIVIVHRPFLGHIQVNQIPCYSDRYRNYQQRSRKYQVSDY